jgi:RimJ/RimL family protein N-acetyltransferase
MRRLATPEDLHAVFTLYMHEKVVPYLGYDPMPLEDFRPIYQEMVESGRFFVYELDGRIAGFYRATRYPGRVQHVASLGTLAVDPALHGQGVALAMVSQAIDELKAAGVNRIETLRRKRQRAGPALLREAGLPARRHAAQVLQTSR